MLDFHLHLARFESPEAIAKALFEANVLFNSIACEPWEWDSSLNLMEKGVIGHFFFGIHPMVASKMGREELNQLEEILQKHPEVNVGECGLDKRFDGYDAAGIQEQVFKKQAVWAKELNRSLQVHCVGDYARILRVLREITPPQVIFHRFGGDISIVRTALRLFGTKVLFSLHGDSFRKKSTRDAIREIPLEQVRFETDADDKSWNAERIVQQLDDVARSFGSAR